MKLILTTDDGIPLGEVTDVQKFGDLGLEESRPGSFRMTQALTFAVAQVMYRAVEPKSAPPPPEPTAGNIVNFKKR